MAPPWEREVGIKAPPGLAIPRKSGSRAEGQDHRVLPDLAPSTGLEEKGANEPGKMRVTVSLHAEGGCCLGGHCPCPPRPQVVPLVVTVQPSSLPVGLALGCEGLRRPFIPPNFCHIGPWVQANCEGSTWRAWLGSLPSCSSCSPVIRGAPATSGRAGDKGMKPQGLRRDQPLSNRNPIQSLGKDGQPLSPEKSLSGEP